MVERLVEPSLEDERAVLEGFLYFGRSTLLVKCSGLTGAPARCSPRCRPRCCPYSGRSGT
jgi:hypothetical protein